MMSIENTTNFHLQLLRQLNGCIFIMDHQSTIIYSNDRTAKLCGYPNEAAFVGNNATQLPCPAAESAPDFFQQDRYVLSTLKELTLLDIHTYANDQNKIFLTKKLPFYLDNKLVGVLCHGVELNSDTIVSVSSALINSDKSFLNKKDQRDRSYTIGSTLSNNHLSARELDCLFYLIRGKTMKETAKALAISPRTVETYLEQIKNKTQLKSRGDVVDYAIASGYLNYIPESYFSNNMSCILA